MMDMSEEQDLLREISRKLDQLVVLTKIGNMQTIEEHKARVRGDKVSAKILDHSDGTLSYSDLCEKVSSDLGVAEITVRKKISGLLDMGFLVSERKGRRVYYATSGLFG